MTQSATALNQTLSLALYLGESCATAQLFTTSPDKKNTDKDNIIYEKSVYLPQVSLKNLLLHILGAAEEQPIASAYVVTNYMDRLKNFRLGGSVVQIVPKGFENSYTISNTQYLSLAAPSLIISYDENSDLEFFKKELVRVRKINAEVNKVVLQYSDHLITDDQKKVIVDLFTEENFKIFECSNVHDLNLVRKTLLNAGSEGTKDEIISDLTEILGEDLKIQFWIKDGFQQEFENIDLYWSSNFFLKNYLETKKIKSAFYFDFEKWHYISTEMKNNWISPWGRVNYEHPEIEKFEIDPFAELTTDTIGQLVTSETTPQHEPGPILAGRSVKALVLDCFYDELKSKAFAKEVFPQLSQASIHQKLENHFQVLEKAQTLEETLLSRENLKEFLRTKLATWVQLKTADIHLTFFGDLAFLFKNINPSIQFKVNTLNFKWTEAIKSFIEDQGDL